ncbi:hypothetical protein BPT24_023 [Tenacibaculum phage pT24]|uniref:Uncharacterized protein n=1 Tax=Tenacibaculum phage pT24 TaxID=1880590 RepID=A0A1B4XWH7_9CAUD|nr:hypothetical protein HYP10_gp023 [Tenacibaculum phage pT24]BAV39145.1 hypothetical protein BPT24_023 [Tenacibaculum phage pT24]
MSKTVLLNIGEVWVGFTQTSPKTLSNSNVTTPKTIMHLEFNLFGKTTYRYKYVSEETGNIVEGEIVGYVEKVNNEYIIEITDICVLAKLKTTLDEVTTK